MRELRAESRRASNYWLRVFGAGAMVLVLGLILSDPSIKPAECGSRLFYGLNAVCFTAIWLLAPLSMSDCLSRERREGTLGLLFLTSLRPSAIVGGKSLIHGWRSITIIFAMIPLLLFPILLGGVTGYDIAMALVIDASAFALALGAGLLASVCVKDGSRVLLATELLSVLFAILFLQSHYRGFVGIHSEMGHFKTMGAVSTWSVSQMTDWYLRGRSPVEKLIESFTLNTGFSQRNEYRYWRMMEFDLNWSAIWTQKNPAFRQAWFRYAIKTLIGSWLAFGAIFWLASWRLARSWRDQPETARQIKLRKCFCSPRFLKKFFRGKMTRSMNRNPVGWLQQCAWQARAMRWGWCLGLVVAECFIVTDPQLAYIWIGQYWMAELLLLALAFVAAGSFRQERETGVLELLLVTPLREFQVIMGRLRGIWAQFFPAASVFLVAWLYLAKDSQLFSHDSNFHLFYFMGIFAMTYLCLPVIGLWLSLRPMPFIGCWLVVSAWGILVPWLIYAALSWRWFELLRGNWGLVMRYLSLNPFLVALIFQFTSAVVAGVWLYRDLARRRF
jgi:ABC-type transport system involved in multi-copper enzyme maturation permease subunit